MKLDMTLLMFACMKLYRQWITDVCSVYYTKALVTIAFSSSIYVQNFHSDIDNVSCNTELIMMHWFPAVTKPILSFRFLHMML